jgi:methanogenic corrinoid protein MtbC1
VRTPGGFRLYGEEDAERVVRMRRALNEGLSAAEAARVALATTTTSDRPVEKTLARLMSAIVSYDEAAVQSALDEGLATFGLEMFISGLIVPALTAVGRGWEDGSIDISQEHFASNLIRGRLLSMARLWGRGTGPLAVLACAPGEQHDISLIAFGLVVRSYGWRILFLGTDTPLATLHETAKSTGPAAIVLATFDTELVRAERSAVRGLARTSPLFLSGPGATEELTRLLRVRRLGGDLIDAAGELVTATTQ